ncbi:hypothetical protein BDR05DRAFT_962946, partial [Suillus weaverae]
MEVGNEHEANSPQMAHSGRRCSDAPTSFKLPASTRCMTIIPELRWKIFQLVHGTPADSMGNKTLLALALTCKSFSGPALDLLWQNLEGIERLIRCLPQSLWKLDKQKLVIMTVDDWTIFCKYNHRVRSFTPTWNLARASTEIWRAL